MLTACTQTSRGPERTSNVASKPWASPAELVRSGRPAARSGRSWSALRRAISTPSTAMRTSSRVGAIGVEGPAAHRELAAAHLDRVERAHGHLVPRGGGADRRHAVAALLQALDDARQRSDGLFARAATVVQEDHAPGLQVLESRHDDGVHAWLLEVARVGGPHDAGEAARGELLRDRRVRVAIGRAHAGDRLARDRLQDLGGVVDLEGELLGAQARQVGMAPGVVGDGVALGDDLADEVGVPLGGAARSWKNVAFTPYRRRISRIWGV